MGAQSERIDSRTTLTWRPKGHAVGAAVGMRAVTVLARAPVAMVVAMKMASSPMAAAAVEMRAVIVLARASVADSLMVVASLPHHEPTK